MERDLKRTIGMRVRAARQKKRLSQEALAELIGRATETVSNIERGKTLPTLNTLEELSAYLSVPLREFFADISNTGDPARIREEFRLREIIADLSNAALNVVIEHAKLLASLEKAQPPKRRSSR